MLRRLLKVLTTAAILWPMTFGASASTLDYKSVWDCDASKFSWYCDQETEEADASKAEKKPSKQQTDQEKAVAEIERMRKDLEAKKALAIMSPTPENVKAYIVAQEVMMDKASTFSDTWRRVIWQNPDLNYEMKRPVNNAAIASYNDNRRQAETKTLESIKKEWGIFFFFRSDCPYCHRMAPTMKFIQDQYGITVFPVSGDGGGLKEFQNVQRDNGLADRLGVKQVPTLVLGNIKDRRMVMLGSGVISAQDIIERIYILTSSKPGELY